VLSLCCHLQVALMLLIEPLDCCAQAVQPPHPALRLQDLPLQKYRDPDSWTLFSPEPGEFLSEVPVRHVAPNSPPLFLGCLRLDLDPDVTEREDLEAVFEYMQQHPSSNRFEMRMQSQPDYQ
jgi:hypothetical protein